MQAPLQARNGSDAVQSKTARTATQERRLVDNRPTAVAHRELAEMMNNSPRVLQQRALSDAIHNSPRMVAQRHEMNPLFGGTVNPQRDGAIPAEASPAQHEEKTNNTGLPNQLKSGIESLSGLDMSGVRVHRNSDKPVQLNALAYAQGSDIHLGPGQEQHLPHEAWHVVQQAQGRVRPTMQMKAGVSLNDDACLESEADAMGVKALAAGGGIVQQMDGDAPPLRVAPDRSDSAIQLVPRTQTVPLVTTHDPRYMGLASGGAGQPPLNVSVGVARALGTDGWDGVAIAPTAEYWRAHALAEVLGGQGDNTNVGWWTRADEDAWSGFEEKAQGRRGPGFDKDFQPGATEQGTYTVISNNAQVNVKPNFVAGITLAVNKLENATLNYVGTAAASGVATQAGVKWEAATIAARNALRALAAGRIDTWLDVVFAPTAGGPFAWTSLAGTYQRTSGPGSNKGKKRKRKMEHTQTPKPLLAADFGIKPGSEAALWGLMRDANAGVYTNGNNPFKQLSTVIGVTDATAEVGKFRFTIGAHPNIDVDFEP